MTPRIMSRRLLLAAALALSLVGTAQAQGTWPDKPLRFVVPFPAGGPLDTLARAVAEPLTAASGKAVVVENTPGGAGNIAIQQAARAAGDGST